MRAEVGLLTRNVIFRGDPETSANNQYGAHIMLHSKGDESLIGRIEYCEFTDVGQAFQLGRYPIHFHLIGTVHYSYIRGNAIHHTYNRAVTIHAVHYLRVQFNVAYKTMGHTFFIEDAVETKNVLEKNLVILTQRSWSLLNTDQTPASFWITHPDNIFRGNRAAGSDRYGYWFDTKPNSMGPSFDPNVCPENSPLGEFTDNVAHSNGRYGLRLFHNLIPRTYPCRPIVYDPANLADPYWKNPLITATFKNFLSYKNQRNGAIAERVGDVRFENFKVADNLIAGIEFSLTKDTMDGTAQINGALCVGHSANADDLTREQSLWGIITPRTENFQVKNVKFFNYNLNDMAAIGSCSHCFHPASTDSGARTITFSGLFFDSTVTKKIRYQYPWRDIFYDLDGTLTGKGPKTWATPYFAHNEQPECTKDEAVYNGLTCDSTVQVRRLAMYNYSPAHFELMELKILKHDDTVINAMDNTTKTAYLLNETNYGLVPFKPKLDPGNGWAVPYVTGHKYKVHWRYGLDFMKMQIDLSSRWQTTDKNVYLFFNFTDVREKVEVITAKDIIPNETLTKTAPANWQTGDNIIYNDTATREVHLIINGKNETRKSVNLVGYRCVGSCLAGIDDVPIETNTRRWSDPKSWDSGKIPVAGENVEIKSGWNMIYDIEESPIVNVIQLNGRLTFENGKNLHLRCKYLFVRAGELIIGDELNPFLMNAKITLFGEKANQHIVYDNAIEAGNKIIANSGKIQMYGEKRNWISRLTKSVNSGDQEIFVNPGLSWNVGDKLGFPPSNMRYQHSDYAVIVSYNNVTGVTKLDRKLSFYHYGAPTSTADQYSGVDIRGEVYMMTRNIQIAGQDVEAWGCQIVTSDFVEINGPIRQGQTIMDNVEIYNCSQYDTFKAAIRFEGNGGRHSSITNSVLRHGLGVGAQFSNAGNTILSGNIVFDFYKIGINIESSRNITLDNNHVSRIIQRKVIAFDQVVDLTGGIFACALVENDKCPNLKLTNNVVSGADNTGYSMYAHECNDYSTIVFKNNVAHSIQGTGAIIYKNPLSSTQSQCLEGSYFIAYKNTLDGAVTYAATKKAVFSNMIFIDNGYGGTVNVGQEGDDLVALMKNSKFYGETEIRDCDKQDECRWKTGEGCFDRHGLMIPYFSTGGKPPLVKKKSALPYHKIKSDASYGGKAFFENIQFINFKSDKTWCGNKQKIIVNNEHASDYIPRVKFTKTLFNNVDNDAIGFLYHPPKGWANTDDCGNWPCTAPNNTLLMFDKTQYSGTITPVNQDQSFQIISNNPPNANGYKGCNFVQAWNAYYCLNENLAILLFESLDDDKWKRMITPIYLKNEALGVSNAINTFMDHIWDGFYTGQLRMSRWPALIQVGSKQVYDITYTGTPPNSQRFTLHSDYSSITVRIKYPKAGSYVMKTPQGVQIEPNAWDNNIKQPALIRGSQCGEFRFLGVVNLLEFFLTSGCTIHLEPIDSIQASIRLNWTLSAFYADGGTLKFIDRMAASLGIHASTIKIVSVYEGSVIVDFQIRPTQTVGLVGGISAVNAKLNDQIANNKIFLGAPILGASLRGMPVKIITDSNNGNKPTTGGSNSNTATQGGTGSNTNTGSNGNTNNGNTQTRVETNGNGNIYSINETVQSSEKNKMTLIIVICVIVGLIIASGIIGFFIYRKCKNLPKQDKTTVAGQPEIGSPDRIGGSPDEVYEPQYHPKADIDIFNRDDPLKKQNEADSVINDQTPNDTDGDEENHNNYTNQSNIGGLQVREDTHLSMQNFNISNGNLDYKNKEFMKTHDTPNVIKKKPGASPMADI